jgi:Flp pilus assembly protein TadD
LEAEPKESGLLNNYAWVLATSPDDNVRDGKLAVELATKACEVTNHEESHILSTLAAAYAEAGDFDKATEWSQKAIEVFETQRAAAIAAGNQAKVDDLSKELQEELASFKAKKPWRERQTMEDEQPAAKEKPAEEPKPAAETADAK